MYKTTTHIYKSHVVLIYTKLHAWQSAHGDMPQLSFIKDTSIVNQNLQPFSLRDWKNSVSALNSEMFNSHLQDRKTTNQPENDFVLHSSQS